MKTKIPAEISGKLTHSQFMALLAAKKGTSVITIKADTEPDMYKTGNPHKNARKQVYKRVVSGASYKNAVEKQSGREFMPAPLPYGDMPVKDKVIRTAKGDLQLRVVSRNPLPPISVRYVDGGQVIDKELIKPFLKTRQDNSRQESVGLQGKRQVGCVNYGFKNIQEVVIDKRRYELVPDHAPEQVIAKKQVMRKNLERAVDVGEQLRRMVADDMAQRMVGKGQ